MRSRFFRDWASPRLSAAGVTLQLRQKAPEFIPGVFLFHDFIYSFNYS
jgi:hypothetical protein